jgi:hypothetical protein
VRMLQPGGSLRGSELARRDWPPLHLACSLAPPWLPNRLHDNAPH